MSEEKHNPYAEHGFDSREDYLESLSEEYGVPLDTVLMLADLLGPSEDFDGLVSTLEDVAGQIDHPPRPDE